MTEAMTRSIPDINAVGGFDPTAFARTLENDDGTKSLYLDVKYRLLWFRLAHPNSKIDSEVIRADEKSALVSCKLYAEKSDLADQYISKASAQRFASNEKYGDRFLETAETAALGRALAAAGFGTQFCGNMDCVESEIVDAPSDLKADMISPANDQALDSTSGDSIPEALPHSAQVPVQLVSKQEVIEQKTPETLDEWIDAMSLEEAKQVVVDVGRYSGTTLGEIAMIHPADLDWYVRNYGGRNMRLKAGATVLVRAAMGQAS